MKIIDVFNRRWLTLGFFLQLCLWVACRAEGIPNPRFDSGVSNEAGGFDLPPQCNDLPKLGPPKIENPPVITHSELQPLRGHADPGARTITVNGGLGVSAPATVGSDGSFCVEVALLPDSPNTIQVTAWDAYGCPGEAATLVVTHKTTAKQDSGVLTEQNISRLQPIFSSAPPEPGSSLNLVNDGKAETSAKLSFQEFEVGKQCKKSIAVWIDLGKAYNVTKVSLKWPSNVEKLYATGFAILFSTSTNPGSPLTGDSWHTSYETCSNSEVDQELPVNFPGARYAALLLYENAALCLDGKKSFLLGEFEVYGRDPSAAPSSNDRCL